VHLDDGTFADLIGRTRDSVLQTHRHAQYPPGEVADVVRAVNLDRGVDLDLGCEFHSVITEGAGPADGAPPPGRAVLAAASAHSTLRRSAGWNHWRRLQIELRGSAESLWIFACADPRILPFDDLAALVRGIEVLAVRAVHEPVKLRDVAELIGVATAAPGERMVQTEVGWVDPVAVETILRGLPGVVACRVVVAGEEPGLVAEVATADGSVDPAALHRSCMARLGGDPRVCAPRRYVVRRRPEGVAGSLDWATWPIVAAGDGRQPAS
jgi:hypothetical protein